MIPGIAGGCALVLGFEDTTLRTGDIDEGGVPESGPLPDGESKDDAGPSRLTVSPSAAVVRRGGTLDLSVDLARGNDVTGAVTVRVSDLPAGVTATAPALAPAESRATVTLTAAKSATLGSSTIKLTVDGAPTTLPPLDLPLLVADGAGSLDVTFDADGFLSDASRGAGSTFFSLALQSDGKIVAGGAAGAGGAAPLAGWMVRRYASNGAPDAPFNTTAAGLPNDGELHAVAVDSLGRIVCVGSSAPPLAVVRTLAVARLTPAGGLDATFGGGIQRLPVVDTPLGSIGLGVAIQPDDKIVVVGSRNDAGMNESGLVTRFRADGTRDPAFNGGALLTVANTRFVGVAREMSGALIVAGSSTGGALPSYVLMRRTEQGAVDPTFGTGGTASLGNTYGANGFARLGDGTLAIVGDVRQGVAGYTAGMASPSGAAAFARAFANLAGAGYHGVAAQDQSRIVAAGHSTAANGEARVDRIFVDGGSKDGTFSDGGVAIIEPGGVANGFDVTLFAAAVQPDGRILAAGNRSNAGAVIYRLWP